MRKEIETIYNSLLDLFFPKICEGCGVGGAYLCSACLESKVQYVTKQACHVCKIDAQKRLVHEKCKEKTHLDGVFIAAYYSKFLEDFIGDIKYELYHAMLPDLMSIIRKGITLQKGFLKIIESKNTFVTYVPLHISRRRWRGFNQAEQMAKELSEYFNLPCQKLLNRDKQTHSQMGLEREERLRNVQGVFSRCGNLDISGYSSIIIIDDVMTTGATLEECAKVLKHSFNGKIYGLVCARG